MRVRLMTLMFGAVLSGSSASAQFFNNRAVVQGFLKQGSTALNDVAGYPMKFIVKRGSTEVWCQAPAAPIGVVNGIFNKILSGAANCDSLSNQFDPSVFSHSANSDIFTIDVVVDINKDGFGGADDATFAGIDVVSSPLAMFSNYANTSLNATNATNATNAVSATTATTAVSATNATNATNAVNATNVTGVVGLANGGTGATTATAARTNLGLGALATLVPSGNTAQFLRGDGTWNTPPAAPVSSVAGRTGAVTLTNADVAGLGNVATMDSSAFLLVGPTTNVTDLNASGNVTVGGALNVTGNITGTVLGSARQSSSSVANATSGSTTAYTLSNSPAISALATGTAVMFKVNATNTGAATLNVDGTGAKSIFSEATGSAVAAGDLVAGKFLTAVYDGTNWVAKLPPLVFTASALNCGTSITARSSVACPTIAATNVNTGDLVVCSPAADPGALKVQWSSFVSGAGLIKIVIGCANGGTACTLTSVNWKCVVTK